MTITTIALEKGAGPFYRQIADAISQQISSGQLKPGHKLPTHRSLADNLEVTVGTITRAYAEAERRGLVEARVGAGTYVRDSGKAGWLFAHAHDSQENNCRLDYNIPPALDRSQMIRQAMATLASVGRNINQLLIYQSAEGIREHKYRLADWLVTQGINIDADRLLFTAGAQNATQMILSAFCQAGDTLLVESLTYPGLINLARQQQLTLKPVAMDEQGILPESLENACRQYKPRFLYAMPTFQNPTTAIMSEQRRQDILAVCRKHNVLLIEDDVNGLLPENRPPAMVNLDSETVIHIGALSKFLAPGLRVGYVQAPKKLYKRLMMTIQNQCWMISPILTGLACELIDQGFADQTLKAIRIEMRARRQLVQQYLEAFSIQTTEDCFHAWLPVPEHWSLTDFLEAAEGEGVSMTSGELFVPPGCSIPPAVRLSFSAPESRELLENGLEKIRNLLIQQPLREFSL